MPRSKLVRTDDLPYHIVARCNNREPFPCPLDRAWKAFCELLYEFSVQGRLRVHAFVLMPNHFHLIASTPDADLDRVMMDFMRTITRTIQFISGRTGHIFGGPYRQSLIDSTRYFAHAFKYVYRNPVKGGICEKVEDYPYGTLSGLLGRQHLALPLFYPFDLGGFYGIPDEDSEDFLRWLNQPFPSEQEALVRRALGKKRLNSFRGVWKERFDRLDAELPQK